jgi:hypothetical protein
MFTDIARALPGSDGAYHPLDRVGLDGLIGLTAAGILIRRLDVETGSLVSRRSRP